MQQKEMAESKEEIAEGWCFVCKDGGDLRICDFKKCSKAYHPECVGKDDSFLDDDDDWKCRWHACYNCNKVAKFYCYCCPTAVCGRCRYYGVLAIVKDNRGFCGHCLALLSLIEGTKAPTPSQVVDFDDQETYEFFFKNYWEKGVKKTEALTREHLISAEKRFKKKSDCDDGLDDKEDSSGSSWSTQDHDDVNFGEDHTDKRRPKVKKAKPTVKMGKHGSRRKEFMGWCSRQLFEFLVSIGKDTSQQLAQHDVAGMITKYSAENNLFHPEKKKMILCDANLYKLFGRKSVNKNRMHGHLTKHFADNQSDDDLDLAEEPDYWFVPDDEENAESTRKRQRFSVSQAECQEKEAVPLVRRGTFASIITKNIKLLYLKRAVVEELSKESETFDNKLIGSFVRVKADPYDYSQKNAHLLVQVKGVRRTRQIGDSKDSIFLQVSDVVGEIPICKLADENFTEEECQDLHRRVKDGLLKRPVVVEFEEKARILHESITKDWIQRELVILKRLISQANLKGWRKELSEYLERQSKLQTPEEQSRLLQEIPEVVADEEEVQRTFEEDCRKEDDEQEVAENQEMAPNEAKGLKTFVSGSRKYWCATNRVHIAGDEVVDNFPGVRRCVRLDKDENAREERSKNAKTDCEGDEVGDNCPGVFASVWSEKVDESRQEDDENKQTDVIDCREDLHQQSHHSAASEIRDDDVLQIQNEEANKYHLNPEQRYHTPDAVSNDEQVELLKPLHDNGDTRQHTSGVEFIQLSEADDAVSASNHGVGSSVQAKKNRGKKPFADNIDCIVLSDDDDDDTKQTVNMNARTWNCMRSDGGQLNGQFSILMLKKWKETSTGPYLAQFKVWREDQTKEDAVFLDEAIRQAFPPMS